MSKAYNQSVSQMSLAASTMTGMQANVKFLNNSQQNLQLQNEQFLGFQEAKKAKEKQQAQNKKEKKQGNQTQQNPNQAVIPRGKHKKIQKMKEKYADQGDEERAMRLIMLGAKDVQGFDITKHGDKKMKYIEKKDKEQEESSEEEEEELEEEEEEAKEEEPNMQIEEQKLAEIDEDLDENIFDNQEDDIDPDALIE